MACTSILVRLFAVLFIHSFSNCCSALTLPLNISSSISQFDASSTNLSEPNRPEWFPIADAPGFSIHFEGYGTQLKPNDCSDALITARWWLYREYDGAEDYPMGLEDSQTFKIGEVTFTITVTNTLTYEAASMFIGGILRWSSMYGYSEVEKILFVNQNHPPLASATLEAVRSEPWLSQSNQTLNSTTPSLSSTTTRDPFNDPFLYPIVSMPGYYIRFMTYNIPLPREDARLALEDAHDTIYKAYQQKIPLLQKTRTFSYGGVSFTITASGEMKLLDAATFITGTQNLGSEKGYVKANAIFLKTAANLRGTMVYCGTGRLMKRVRTLS